MASSDRALLREGRHNSYLNFLAEKSGFLIFLPSLLYQHDLVLPLSRGAKETGDFPTKTYDRHP